MLHFRKMGAGAPLFIVHGLFGSSDNWQGLAKKYAEHYEVYLVDQRNHGHSFHSDEPFDYDVMALDLLALIEQEGLSGVSFIGHSMGGKSVMRLAQIRPDVVEKLVVADMGVKAYPPHHDKILAGLNAVDLSTLTKRKEVEEVIAQHVADFSVRMFLMKNLYWKEKGVLGWRINIPVLTRDILNVVAAIPDVEVDVPALFITGGSSNYVLESDREKLTALFPQIEFHVIEEVGHWLHAESPEEFYVKTISFLQH